MAQFVRIGVLVVDLEQCAFETVDGPAIRVYTQGRTFGPYPEKSDMYRVLEAWMSQQEDLEDVVEREDMETLHAEEIAAEEKAASRRQQMREWATEHEEAFIDHDPDDPFLSAPDDTYTV